MLKFALTGNIASGKSMLLEYFKNDGVKTLCLDKVTNDLYNKREIIFSLIDIVGTYERKTVAKVVFSDKEKKKQVEELFMPEIKKVMFEFFEQNKNEKCTVVAAPILFEVGFDQYFDKIIMITADETIRLNRLILRDNLTEHAAKIRMNAQGSENEKIEKSDFVIFNNGELNDLRQNYLKLKEVLCTLL